MNTTGFLRGYMRKQMKTDDFLEVVTKTLSAEFEEELYLYIDKDGYEVQMLDYRTKLSNEQIDELKSPYSIDRHILTDFERQGFTFDRNRSQYIQTCFR